MGWIVFEALLALGVLLALVWWTFRGRVDSTLDQDDDADKPRKPQ